MENSSSFVALLWFRNIIATVRDLACQLMQVYRRITVS
jgi:hypothetical protein